MARFRRQLALRPVQRIKHIVDSAAALASSASLPIVIVHSVNDPDTAVFNEVKTGSTVHGLFLNVQVASNENVADAIPNVYMAVYKSNAGALATLRPDSLGDDPNRKFVIHQEMTMIENIKGGNPHTLFKGVITIPRGYKRFGIDDELIVVIRCNQLDTHICLQAIYKEFQ